MKRKAVALLIAGLQAVQSERSLDALDIETLSAKNFDVSYAISEAQFMVGLQLAAVAHPAQTFEIFAPVWIARSQFPD